MKAPVKRFQVGGRARPARFSYNALAEFCDRRGYSLADLQSGGLSEKNLGLADLRALLYCGLEDGARKEREAFEVEGERATEWDAGEWMQEMSDSQQEEFFAYFEEASAAVLGDGSEDTSGKAQEGEAAP